MGPAENMKWTCDLVEYEMTCFPVKYKMSIEFMSSHLKYKI